MMLRPTGITADRHTAILTVEWSDGHQTAFPFYDLSAACPCASCNEKRQQLEETGRNRQKDFVPQSSKLGAIEPVGTYAINIAWQDGCRYGIYSWELLLQLEAHHPEWRMR